MILVLHQLGDLALDARVGKRVTVGNLVARREEVLQVKHPVGRRHVLARNRTAHRGLVHADGVCNHHHGHRPQRTGSNLHELPLTQHNLVSDVRNRLLPLVNAFDQKLAAADFITDVILHFAAAPVLGHQVFVHIRNPQMRDLIAVEGDLPRAPDFFDGDIGEHVVVRVGREDLSRLGIEGGNEVCGPLHMLDRCGKAAGNLGEAAFA